MKPVGAVDDRHLLPGTGFEGRQQGLQVVRRQSHRADILCPPPSKHPTYRPPLRRPRVTLLGDWAHRERSAGVGAIESAIAKLRDLIASGELSPGDRLPPEPELAALVGVPRNTLRDAVRALIHPKVLDVRRAGSTYLTSPSPHLLLCWLIVVVDLM